MATHSAPPCSSLPQPPPPLSDLLPLEQHLDAAADVLSRDLAALKSVVTALEKEASQAAAEAASARELARAAEASAAASTIRSNKPPRRRIRAGQSTAGGVGGRVLPSVGPLPATRCGYSE